MSNQPRGCKCKKEHHSKKCHHHKKPDCSYQLDRIESLNRLRLQFPNDPSGVGSSTNRAVLPFEDMHIQSGGAFSSACKFEYDSKTNKYSIPSLGVTQTFDLVPSTAEAGQYEQQILDAGYANWPRDRNQVFYPATQDEHNFYYSVNGGSLFGSYFGFGTSTLFVARRKRDGKLLWAMNSLDYRVDNPEIPTYFGTTNVLSRVTLAIFQDRLYVTTLVTNIGPQLFVIDKSNGSPIWSMAYELPAQMAIDLGQTTLCAPSQVPFNSFDGSPYIGSNVAMGDVNLNVVKLNESRASVFFGISSFQNAINPSAFTSFTRYTDQGKLIRVDDQDTLGVRVWETPTCAPLLHAGDQISTSGPVEKNPFRPGQYQVYIWRDITSNGTFSDAGGVNAAILDYTGANPGYIPAGYPLQNNLTTPCVANVLLIGGNPALTEGSVQNLYRSPAPGVGASASIYYYDGSVTQGPVDITNFLSVANVAQAALPVGGLRKWIIWTYANAATVNAVNVAAWGSSNAGIRYIASLPDNYVIANEQEAEALNYYGNSVWGQAPVVDVKRNMVYFGCGQTHSCPVDELLVFQDPEIEYLMRKQPVIDAIYQYARPDESTDLAPYSTLEDVNAAKDHFIDDQKLLNLDFSLKSPRGNMSYCDALIGADLTTGAMQFGYRIMEWDAVTFTADDPSLLVIQAGYADADASSGIMLMENVVVDQSTGGTRTFLASSHKGSMIATLDISGLNPNVQYNHYNILEKGVVPDLFYAGPDGALGGSNYGLCQDGGSKMIWNDANDGGFVGSFSLTYNTGYYQGYEFHITRDGRVLLPNSSFVAAYDLARKETVWETSLGQLTHSQVQSFNGVTFVPRGDGVLIGIDNGSGEIIYKDDFRTPFDMAGITPPTFDDQGRGVFICNYQLPIFGKAGQLGSTGTLLNVDPCKLLTPKDCLRSLTCKKTFDSIDVVPKRRGVVVQQEYSNDQTVQHVWGRDGNLHVLHVLTDADDNTTSYEADFVASKFVYASQQILFDNYPTQNGLRYVSLTLMTRDKYVLEFQIIGEDESVTNYQATLKITTTPAPCHGNNRSASVAAPVTPLKKPAVSKVDTNAYLAKLGLAPVPLNKPSTSAKPSLASPAPLAKEAKKSLPMRFNAAESLHTSEDKIAKHPKAGLLHKLEEHATMVHHVAQRKRQQHVQKLAMVKK